MRFLKFQNDRTNQIILYGNGGVGKTSYINKLIRGEWEGRYVASESNKIVNPRFYSYGETKQVIQFYDTAGQELVFRNVSMKFGDVDAVFVFFSHYSMLEIKGLFCWVKKARENYPKAKIVLVGNKLDVDGSVNQEKTRKIYKNVVKKLGLPIVNISVKTEYGLLDPLKYVFE